MQRYQTELVSKNELTPRVVELRVRLVEPETIKIIAGQFMQFQIDQFVRAYSIINAPGTSARELDFCVELINGGVGSEFVRRLKPGDRVDMRGPLGTFRVEPTPAAYFVATGVGIAPFHAMIPAALAAGQTNVSLL